MVAHDTVAPNANGDDDSKDNRLRRLDDCDGSFTDRGVYRDRRTRSTLDSYRFLSSSARNQGCDSLFFPIFKEYVYSIARPTMFASFPVFFLLAILHNWLGNRQEERTKRRLLKRFFSGDTGR